MRIYHNEYLHDACIEKIKIADNVAKLYVTLDSDETIMVRCSGVVAIDHLCMWEDTIIHEASLQEADRSIPFLKEIEDHHPRYNDENDPIKEGLLDFAIKLTNEITFHIYCYKVDVLR